MSLKIIKSKLEKIGYHCCFYQEGKEFTIGTITRTIPELNGFDVHVYCKVLSANMAYIIEYFEGQLVRSKDFSTTTQVVKYIQSTYPLP